MARLFDRVYTHGFHADSDHPAPRSEIAWAFEHPGEMPCILIDNVCDFHFDGGDAFGGPSDQALKRFPQSAPPWPRFWMEFTPQRKWAPPHLKDQPISSAVGIMYKAEDLGEAGVGLVTGEHDMYVIARPPYPDNVVVARWLMRCAVFLTVIGGDEAKLCAVSRFWVSPDGYFIPGGKPSWTTTPAPPKEYSRVMHSYLLEGGYGDDMEAYYQRLHAIGSSAIYPTLIALAFCNSGVQLSPAPGPSETRLVSRGRGRRRKPKRAVGRYQVLEIEPIMRAVRAEMHRTGVSMPQALHNVRGHWARYGKDGKGLLFGKYERDVWVPNHERGTRAAGVTLNDFEVMTPQASPE